ncbi:MAG: hypothetical protein C0490_26490, partial [Marivirga sp.]|nr:hypothetical protein [Marivirga sp.]
YDAGEFIPAIRYFNRIAGLELTDKRLYEDVRHFELLMLSERGDMIALARQINKGITFDRTRALEKLLFTALLAESSGDTTLAKKNYEILGTYNPYFEEGIISAAAFFRKHGKNKLKPYTILAEAIQINSNSIRLLRAYASEAGRMGFDQYAFNVIERLKELEKNLR